MIEMVRMHGVKNDEIKSLLEKGDSKELDAFGEGIPDWQTLIDYYQHHKNKVISVIHDQYQITFLTKGALKSLLSFKYGLRENEDFHDNGQGLDELKISSEALQSLKQRIAKNWTIIELSKTADHHLVKIELTHKPAL